MAWSKLYTIAYQEKPISSTKYNTEIDNIYEKLNTLKVSSAGTTTPTDFEVGQLWFDTLNSVLKIKTSSGTKTLAYAYDESNIRSDSAPVFYTLDGSRQMNADYTPTADLHLTTKSYVDALINSHTSNTDNPHQVKESQVIDSTNPQFLLLDGSRQMSVSYTPTLDRHITTKVYVDTLVTNHTSNTSNPHQVKESQVIDDTNPQFLLLDGSREMISSYTPSQAKHVITKDYFDNHANNTDNPHQVKENQVLDATNPVFITIDGSRSMDSSYEPSDPYDVATKGYVDTMVATGGVGSIASNYVTYTVDTPAVSIWSSITNAKDALDLIIDTLNSGIVSDTYKVMLNDSDSSPDYLINKLDANYFEAPSGLVKLKDTLLYKVMLDSSDSSPDYLFSKFSTDYFEIGTDNKIKFLDTLLYKVKVNDSDASPTYLAEKFDINLFEVDLNGKITLKDDSIGLNYIDSGVSIQNMLPITNSSGDFYLISVDTSVFDLSSNLTIKDGAITTDKLAPTVSVYNSDLLDGYHASTSPASSVIPVTDATGKIPSGFLPEFSDADTLDGYHASETPGANVIPVTDADGYFNKWGAVNWVEKQQVISNATGNITWNMDNGGVLKLDPMVGNITLTVTNARYPATYILIAVQDSTGGRTITFPVNFKFQSGETIDTTASKINVISIFYDGTYFYCSVTVY